MHGMHARLPKNFVLEERLERYADAIELEPQRWAGCWAQACYDLAFASEADDALAGGADEAGSALGRYDEVRLDLGCGKGAFVIGSAQQRPNTLYVAMDAEPLCIAYAAQHVTEADLRNVVVVPARGSSVCKVFGPHELACIHLNFPTPYPRKRDAAKRLVVLERLLEYREVLRPGGTIRFRTDSQPLRDFALTQLRIAGYDVVWQSNNARRDRPHEPSSEYEERLVAQGATVYGVWATPGNLPAHVEQTASLSLMDYLPDDLFANGYVPHGMGGAVTNLRNHRARLASSKQESRT